MTLPHSTLLAVPATRSHLSEQGAEILCAFRFPDALAAAPFRGFDHDGEPDGLRGLQALLHVQRAATAIQLAGHHHRLAVVEVLLRAAQLQPRAAPGQGGNSRRLCHDGRGNFVTQRPHGVLGGPWWERQLSRLCTI